MEHAWGQIEINKIIDIIEWYELQKECATKLNTSDLGMVKVLKIMYLHKQTLK